MNSRRSSLLSIRPLTEAPSPSSIQLSLVSSLDQTSSRSDQVVLAALCPVATSSSSSVIRLRKRQGAKFLLGVDFDFHPKCSLFSVLPTENPETATEEHGQSRPIRNSQGMSDKAPICLLQFGFHSSMQIPVLLRIACRDSTMVCASTVKRCLFIW